jgi:hypothetical protein
MVKDFIIGEVNVAVDYERQTIFEALSLIFITPYL